MRKNSSALLIALLCGFAVYVFLQSDKIIRGEIQKSLNNVPFGNLPSILNSPQVAPKKDDSSKTSLLDCKRYGGPEDASEMVYWSDIPSDSSYSSPLKDTTSTQYLTFEPDEGGFNNIRMALETTVAIAFATGRTLVLPPRQKMYLLGHDKKENDLSFAEFYDLSVIPTEHKGLDIISFEDFLKREAMAGNLRDSRTGQVTFPPGNRTNWDGTLVNFHSAKAGMGSVLWPWLRNSTTPLDFFYGKCVAAFPKDKSKENEETLKSALQQVFQDDQTRRHPNFGLRLSTFDGHPVPVNGTVKERLSEILADRRTLCIYNDKYQNARVLHAKGEEISGTRLLVHFYAFLFFEDWKEDLWFKRFVRDHFRYKDEIQCAAARIVSQMRQISQDNGNESGEFYTAHIRRGDFQYQDQKIPAEELYESNLKNFVPEGATLYIATDERAKEYFNPLRHHYKLYFMDDFNEQLKGIDTHFSGMIDQLVASRGEIFVGSYFSTFTGFINRMRGYHTQKKYRDSSYDGSIDSYYYTGQKMVMKRKIMRRYHAVRQPFWAQEFPVAWRDIDHDVVGL